MSESVEEKQEFLRNEIIDKGYNPEEFSSYMCNLKGEEGLDLEKWSISELQSLVDQFKSKMDKEKVQSSSQINENQIIGEAKLENKNYDEEIKEEKIESSDKINTIPEKIEKKNINSQSSSQSTQYSLPNDPFENYEKIIKTAKIEKNEISEEKSLMVEIKDPVKISKGAFSSFYQYTMHSLPIGYKVVRKASDFQFLHETLPLFNSAVFNPILPPVEFGVKDDSPKKMIYLQSFMNSLLENKFFRSLPIVYQFLTVSQDEWNKLKHDTYSKLKPVSLGKMPTIEGEIHININKADDSKALKIKDEINAKTNAYEDFNIAMDELLLAFEKVGLCYISLAKAYADLAKSHKDNKILARLFERLFKLSRNTAKDYVKQRDFYREEIKYFFRFMGKENTSFLRKCEGFKTARDDYKSKYDKVKKMPNKLQKDLETVLKLRRDYGLQLAAINIEYQRLIERQANRALSQFLKYGKSKDLILQNFNNCIKLFSVNETKKNNEGSNTQKNGQEQEEIMDENQEVTQQENNQ